MGWQIKGNIKGTDGTATIPDPLPVATTLSLGSNARIVALAHGLRIEAKDPQNNWHTQVEWKEDT
jgi:hypothetical protein